MSPQELWESMGMHTHSKLWGEAERNSDIPAQDHPKDGLMFGLKSFPSKGISSFGLLESPVITVASFALHSAQSTGKAQAGRQISHCILSITAASALNFRLSSENRY